jgi:Zn-dependent peptidase ImmA (M78 family)/transcriptional regulator with XRE-family HTH domain
MNADADLAAAHALFDGGQLTLAREYARLRKVELARMLDVTPAAITQYEQGKTRPARATLAALALHLGLPPAFFVASGYPGSVSETSTHFRSLRSTTRMTRLHLLARLQLLSRLIDLVDDHVALPPVDVPRLDVAPGRAAASAAAAAVRERWGLGNGPIAHTARMLEAHGVIVTRPRVDSSDVDAFSCWLGDRPVVVLASDKDDGARSRFDGPHELGHLVMHHEAEPGDPDHERDAHAFAAEFLMPATAIRAELPARLSWSRYIELKARWGVSISALLRRARDLDVITQYAYERAMVQLSKKGWRIHEPAPVPVEDPTLLQRALALMADAEGLDDRAVAAHLRLHPDQVAELLSDVAVPRRPRLSVTVDSGPAE